MREKKFLISMALAVVAVMGGLMLTVTFIKKKRAKLRTAIDFELDFDPPTTDDAPILDVDSLSEAEDGDLLDEPLFKS